jgi:P-type conjugative transfer ATPase TrbB
LTAFSTPMTEQLAMMLEAFAPISIFLSEPKVVEVMLNPDGCLWVERLSVGMTRADISLEPAIAEGMLRYVAAELKSELTYDRATLSGKIPLFNARVQAFMPPLVTAPALALRRPASEVYPLSRYVERGILQSAHAQFLEESVRARANILIAGGTGSGKTTFGNALLQVMADTNDRVLILEDTSELQCPAENKVPILVRPPFYSWQEAIMDALRMRPDRIIVGELRGKEAYYYVEACNTGHSGGIATIHAENSHGALNRLCRLVAQELDRETARVVVAETIQVCVHLARDRRHAAGYAVTAVDKVRGYDVDTRRWLLEPVGERAASPIFA